MDDLNAAYAVFDKISWVLDAEKFLKNTFDEDFLNEYILSKGGDDNWHIDALIGAYQELAAQHNIELENLNV